MRCAGCCSGLPSETLNVSNLRPAAFGDLASPVSQAIASLGEPDAEY
jgi:hypothetical protein